MLDYYKSLLEDQNISFIFKYLNDPLLLRLKNIGYFCGMDYASKDIYDFSENISRYDHSYTVALLTYKLTNDKNMTIAGLYHDISTPCFSHVIDYMNNDYKIQESTEAFTEEILIKDSYLKECLKKDGINLEDIINFKKYAIVDNERPKVCADRLDAVILNSIGWTKMITKEDILNIISDITVYQNENNEDEIGFNNIEVAQRFTLLNDIINEMMHSKEDIYMMQLLADITKIAINNDYLNYKDLYVKDEFELFNILDSIKDLEIKELVAKFKYIRKEDIPNDYYIDVKNRYINPIVKQRRLSR